MNKVAIVIPVYNEQKYIANFLHKLAQATKKLPSISLIIIINDGSTDDTARLIREFKLSHVHVIVHSFKQNQGKGAAMQQGLKKAVAAQVDAVIFMDGDGQHDPRYLTSFIRELEMHPIIFGYRNLAKDVPYIRKLGNNIARYIFRTFFNIKRKDLLCGFMAARRDVFPRLVWRSRDYGVEAELSAIVGKHNIPFKELFISTIYYDRYKGVNIIDAFFILLKIPYWYLRY